MVGQNKVNMFNKLYVYVKSRVLESSSINGAMFEKRQIFGSDTFVVVIASLRKCLSVRIWLSMHFQKFGMRSLESTKRTSLGCREMPVKLN